METNTTPIPVVGDLVKVNRPGEFGHGQVGDVIEVVSRGVGQSALFSVTFGPDQKGGWFEIDQLEFVERADHDALFQKYGLRPLANTFHPRYYVVATHVSGERFVVEVENRQEVSSRIKWLRKQEDILGAYEAVLGERQR
jgi:hypothetical protein